MLRRLLLDDDGTTSNPPLIHRSVFVSVPLSEGPLFLSFTILPPPPPGNWKGRRRTGLEEVLGPEVKEGERRSQVR